MKKNGYLLQKHIFIKYSYVRRLVKIISEKDDPFKNIGLLSLGATFCYFKQLLSNPTKYHLNWGDLTRRAQNLIVISYDPSGSSFEICLTLVNQKTSFKKYKIVLKASQKMTCFGQIYNFGITYQFCSFALRFRKDLRGNRKSRISLTWRRRRAAPLKFVCELSHISPCLLSRLLLAWRVVFVAKKIRDFSAKFKETSGSSSRILTFPT